MKYLREKITNINQIFMYIVNLRNIYAFLFVKSKHFKNNFNLNSIKTKLANVLNNRKKGDIYNENALLTYMHSDIKYEM